MKIFFLNTWDIFFEAGAAVAGMLLGLSGYGQAGGILLITAMAADCVLAVRAIRQLQGGKGSISSPLIVQLLSQKGVLLAAAVAAFLLDKMMRNTGVLFFSTAAWLGAAYEGISLLKRLVQAALPLPGWIKEAVIELDSPA